MEDRFRVDGVELGVDRRRSFATVDGGGIASASVLAASPWGDDGAPVRLVVTGIPLRFDGKHVGATVDAELRDRLFAEGLADEQDPGEQDADDADPDDADPDDADPDDPPGADPGVQLQAGSRVEADGRLTHHAGDRLRFVGEATLPGGAPLRLDVSVTFGRRPPRI
jgi:hypothetical protein